MRTLLTTTAIGLIAALAVPAQAQTTDQARVGGPCQQQWTAVDENRDGNISESEAQAAIDLEFQRIDMDDNGTVSVAEWKDCAAPGAIPGGFQAAAETDTGSAERALGETGTAQTGGTADESTAEADTEVSTRTAAAADAWGGEFSQMDTDDSGDISAEEAAEWSRSQATGQQADEEAVRGQAAQWAMLDTNGDGKVTQQEWEQRGEANVEARFSMIDEDSNGEVSESEWRNFREKRFEQAQATAQEQVDLWLFYYNHI